jgi:hypothetical protein
MTQLSLSALSHPDFPVDSTRWYEYRLAFEGGEDFMREYLLRPSDETDSEFTDRKRNTPIPAVAKEAVKDVQRAITQRLADVTRSGGSKHYQAAVAGEGSGIDREGQAMDMFIGQDVLEELLVMGRVGVFVDNVPPDGPTLADGPAKPYAYVYRVEDILNWRTMRPEQEGTYSMVLLRDREVTFSQAFGLKFPNKLEERFRLVWIGADGFMRYRFLDKGLNQISPEVINPQLIVEDDGAIRTQLREIPFVMPKLRTSLLTDVVGYQRLLMNIASNEGMFGINMNSPMLTIQRDTRADGQNWKKPVGGSEEPGGQRSRTNTERQGIRSGWVRGRYYGLEEAQPAWINMPVESINASSEYRMKLADEVRQLVNVAVQNQTGTRSESRETREISAQGLESGLFFIAMKLQDVERKVARYFATYEGERKAAVVTYPKRFNLKTQQERIKDAAEFKKIIDDLPTQELKKEGIKRIVLDLFTGTVSSETMNRMMRAIETHPYIGGFDNVMALIEAGLLTRELAGGSQDLDPEEVKKAAEEKAKMAAEILETQMKIKAENTPERPAARGVPEADANPNSGKEERAEDEQKRGEQKAPLKEEE